MKINSNQFKITKSFVKQFVTLIAYLTGALIAFFLSSYIDSLNDNFYTSLASGLLIITWLILLSKIAYTQAYSRHIFYRWLFRLTFLLGSLLIYMALTVIANPQTQEVVQSQADQHFLIHLVESIAFSLMVYLMMVFFFGAQELIKAIFKILKRIWQLNPNYVSGTFLFLSFMALALLADSATIRLPGADRLDFLTNRLERVEHFLGGDQVLECDRTEVVGQVSKSIVRVVGKFSEGTGVIIDDEGTIITNYHVVAGEPAPTIFSPFDSKRTASYVMTDKELDIAVLSINHPTPNYLKISYEREFMLKPLDLVYSFGFPFGTKMAGRVTVQEGRFVSYRDLDYIQTDLSLQSGQSGGALTDSCGNLHGINRSTLSGISLSIANHAIRQSILEASRSEQPVDSEFILEFRETESPLEAVRAFYNYQSINQLDKAYQLLSPEYLDGLDFNEWSQGYEDTIGVELIAIEQTGSPQTIFLKFASFDLINDQRVTKFFEGTWTTERVGERWLLTRPNIGEVESPERGWFLGE